MRILIADDNELIRQGVRNILASGDNLDVCGEAQDGEETIQRASELLPDLVLLDISMPDVSGLDVARVLRRQMPGTRILMMSQHDPQLFLPRALEAGAHGCLDKANLGSELLEGIRSMEAKWVAVPSKSSQH
ncbi:MAG: response regulator transcription factor [Terriglobales bacterium]|jgi:DNA-binding NarL/FixJ family response regulator